ncbi:MAG: FIST N-terminal domain-containing protein [Myxococcales bacterium]
MAATVVVTLSSASTPASAAEQTLQQLATKAQGLKVRGGIVYHSVSLDAEALRSALHARLPDAALLGSTSCLGVGTSLGGFSTGSVVTGLWLVGDGFRFGVSAAAKDGSAKAKGTQVAKAALAAAGIKPGQTRFAVFHATPGDEEGLLDGAFSSLDRQTALVGGTAADNDLSGQWKVWSHEGVFGSGVAVAVCDWPGKIGVNYQAGYLPTEKRGKVTAARGRTLLAIDGRPAAEVYDQWTGGRIGAELAAGGNVLGKTTMAPLGLPRGLFGGIEAFVLVHPEKVDVPARSLGLFANVEVGQTVALMDSSEDALVHRGANVARTALVRGGLAPDKLAGALVVFCGGCMLAIQKRMPESMDEISKALPQVPYSAIYSFGEQGCVLPKQVAHGNLMASALLLGKIA